jgi:hypothetical protein
MSIRTILAAIVIVGSAAVPALAADTSVSSNTIPTQQLEFFTTGQGQRLVEGRNSNRAVIEVTNKAQAAISQGFAPIDTEVAIRGRSN